MSKKFSNHRKLFSSGWRILKHAWKINKLHLSLMTISVLLTSLLPFLSAWVFNELINTVISISNNTGGSDELTKILIFFIAVRVILSIGYNLVSYSENRLRFSLEKEFNKLINVKLTSLDIELLEDPKFINLKSKATDSYTWRPQTFLSNLLYGIQNIIQILASFVIIFSLSPFWLSIIIISFIPNLLMNFKFSNRQWSIWDTDTETRRKYGYFSWLLGFKNALMEIRLFKAEHFFVGKLMKLISTYIKRNEKLENKRFVYTTITGIFPSLASFSLLINVALQAARNAINIGMLSFYYSTLNEFSMAMDNLVRNMSKAYEHSIFMNDVFNFLDYKNTFYFKNKGIKIKFLEPPLIEFDNISFKYPESDNFIFKNFNLRIKAKESIALIGENGAGKSTLVKLLVRFYKPTKGKILINGSDLNHINPDYWFDKMSILSQEFVHYQFTI